MGRLSPRARDLGFVRHVHHESRGGTSTSHQRAKPDDFLALLAVIPDEQSALEYGVRAMPSLAMASSLRAENQVAARARDFLLPKLVTGKIDVDSLGVDDVFGWSELAEAGAAR